MMSVGAEHYDFMEVVLNFIIHYDIKYRMGNELSKTARHQVPLFLPIGEGVENLTDRRKMFPVGKKTI